MPQVAVVKLVFERVSDISIDISKEIDVQINVAIISKSHHLITYSTKQPPFTLFI